MSRKQHFRPYFDHDDRMGASEPTMRKVSFKHGRINKKKRGQDKIRNFRVVIDDDDVDMNTGEFRSGQRRVVQQGFKKNIFKGRPNSPGLRSTYGGNHSAEWFQITIAYGAKYGKEQIISLLLSHLSPFVFAPIAYQTRDRDSVFYVNNQNAADALRSASRKIQLNDGHFMLIKVKNSAAPHQPIDAHTKDRMRIAMSKRYIAETKSLNLSKFFRDPEFASDGFYCALARPPVFAAVMALISENISDLVALDLSGNRIYTLDSGSAELRKLKNLKILHLGENNIKSVHVLNCLKDMNLTELILEKNPVCNNFTDLTHLVRYEPAITEVRKRIPKLEKLDRKNLPAVLSFDVVEDSKLPTSQAAFLCNAEGRSVVKAFLTQYFALYDSDNRLDLAQAYHENSSFSQCSFYPTNQSATTSARLNAYIQESRNLFRVTDYPRRKSRLFCGKNDIVQYLKSLPKTDHDLDSFAVDLTLFTPALICLTVCGVFREPDSNSESQWPVRHFCRTFLMVPVGAGLNIVNESLMVTNASDEQKANTFKKNMGTQVIMQSPIPSTSTPGSPLSPSTPQIDDGVRLQMMQALAAQSGMNVEWARKCLEETQWVYEGAVLAFEVAKKNGTIPPEAFVK